jgi:SAM-dependent methyltransferase
MSDVSPSLKPIESVASKDTMVWPGAERQYFEIGREAVQLVARWAEWSGKPHFPRILDFGCGYGRVLRWLRAQYPYAEITACDIDEDAVEFCAATFAAKKAYSTPDLKALRFDGKFDLIWCGSVLTHLPLPACREAIGQLISWTSECGLLIFSTQGRYFDALLARDQAPFADNVDVKRLRESFGSDGASFQPYYESADGGYGLTLLSPAFLAAILECDPNVILKAYMEQAWGVQDIVVLYKKDGYFERSGGRR